MCMDDIESWRKRPLLTCRRRAGGWYIALQIIHNLSSHTSGFICDLLGMHTVERSYPRPLAGRLFYCLKLSWKRRKRGKSGLRASTRPSASVDTFVQPPSQNQGHRTNIVICHTPRKLQLYCVTYYLSQNKSLYWYPYLVKFLIR